MVCTDLGIDGTGAMNVASVWPSSSRLPRPLVPSVVSWLVESLKWTALEESLVGRGSSYVYQVACFHGMLISKDPRGPHHRHRCHHCVLCDE